MSNRPLYLDLLLLAVVAVWGANFAVVKYSLAEVSPMAFNSLRFMLALAVMWYLAIHRGSKIRIHKGDVWPLIGLGILGNFVYQVAFIIGIEWSYSANAAVMLGSGPVYVAIMSHFLFKEKVTTPQVAGIITGFLGVLMLIFGKTGFQLELKSGLGDLMLFLAAVCWALYSLLSRNFLSRYKPLDLAVISMTSGGLAIILAGMPWVWQTNLLTLSGEAWMGIVYSGALSIGVSYIIWNHGLSKVGAVRTTAFQNFVPMFGIVFGFLLLDERLSWVQYMGAIFVIAGVVMTRWRW
jgi:drug/metabolite transporter (DMT)-like permease